MRVSWAVPVIASILILGTFGLAQDVFAETIQVNSGTCELPPYNGIFDASTQTCTIPGTLTISSGDEFQIQGVTLKITGTLNLGGRIATNGHIINEGIINAQGGNLIQDGSINIFSEDTIINECNGVINLIGGTGQQSGSLVLSPPTTFTNFGTVNGFNSDPSNSAGVVLSLGLVNNHGTINAPVNSAFGGFFENLPSLCDAEPTTIDVDTAGDQLVGPDDVLIITNGATLTGNVSVDGGLVTVQQGASVDGIITSNNGGSVQLFESCNVSGNIITTDSNVFINSCSIGGHVSITGGSFLVIKNDSTVNGDVNVKNVDLVRITANDNSFNQNVSVGGASSVVFSRNHVTQNLRVQDSEIVTFFGNVVMGDLILFDNTEAVVSQNTVTGNLRTAGTDTVEIRHNQVTGNLNTAGTDTVEIRSNQVTGNLIAAGSISLEIKFNTVGENIRVKGSSNVEIGNNNPIGQNLHVSRNDLVSVTNNHANNNISIKGNTNCIFDNNTAGNKLKIKDCVQVIHPPFITPTAGILDSTFTITDELGRMIVPEGCSGVVLFTPTNPSFAPQAIIDPVFSADGMTVTGQIQFANTPIFFGVHTITVHPCDASDVPFFEDPIQFFIFSPGGGI